MSVRDFFLLLMFANLCCPAVGIIGGVAVPNFPFFVLVVIDKYVCGGSIVDSRFVVTAAHCIYDYDRVVYVAKEDFSNPNWPSTVAVHSCDSYVCHTLYDPFSNGGFGSYDIALVKLKKGFDLNKEGNAKIEPCPDSGIYFTGFAIGMGKTHYTSHRQVSQVLKGVKMHRFANCNDYFQNIQFDEETVVCLGSHDENRPAGTCEGDGGGPIVHIEESDPDATCLIGIENYHYGACVGYGTPAVFNRGDYFAQWIEDNISRLT